MTLDTREHSAVRRVTDLAFLVVHGRHVPTGRIRGSVVAAYCPACSSEGLDQVVILAALLRSALAQVMVMRVAVLLH